VSEGIAKTQSATAIRYLDSKHTPLDNSSNYLLGFRKLHAFPLSFNCK